MKKIICLLIVICTIAGCQNVERGGGELDDNNSKHSSEETMSIRDDAEFQTFNLNELKETYFFNFTVDNYIFLDRYNELQPSIDSSTFLYVEITVENTQKDIITMSSWDFFVEYYDHQNDDIFYSLEEMDSSLMPLYDVLLPNKKSSYKLLFEVPNDATEFSISHIEIFEDIKGNQTYGNLYTMYFDKV